MHFIYPEGATPIDEDERAALLPKHLSLQEELNAWEQINILQAEKWAFGTRHPDLLSPDFVKKLHHKMFEDTWRWAGQFRHTSKNIGVNAYEISQEILKLCEDVKVQLTCKSASLDEIAVHLHHQLVWIHPFPNGNGRHSRIYTDLFLGHHNAERFSWGWSDLGSSSHVRKTYIRALREADRGNIEPLLEFARS